MCGSLNIIIFILNFALTGTILVILEDRGSESSLATGNGYTVVEENVLLIYTTHRQNRIDKTLPFLGEIIIQGRKF